MLDYGYLNAQLQTLVIYYTPKIVSSILILLMFYILAKFLKKILARISSHNNIDHSIYILISKTLTVTLMIFASITVLGTLGVNVTALVGGLGLTGFAISFALKDILSNLLAGVLVLLYRPIKIGDNISIKDFNGTVTNIDLRYTTLQGSDKTILVPNTKIFSRILSINKPA